MMNNSGFRNRVMGCEGLCIWDVSRIEVPSPLLAIKIGYYHIESLTTPHDIIIAQLLSSPLHQPHIVYGYLIHDGSRASCMF